MDISKHRRCYNVKSSAYLCSYEDKDIGRFSNLHYSGNFAVLVCGKLVHSDAKNMLSFTQNVMNSRMNLVPAFQNNRKWLKAERKKILRKLQTYFLCDNMLPENFLFNHKT